MNTLQDLRATLDQHAREVGDSGATRVAAVRARAVRARQRQAGAVAGAAAAVVMTVVATTLLPGGGTSLPPAGPGHDVFGRTAPVEVTALGYTYRFSGAAQGDEKSASLDLEGTDRPRLLTWAADAPVTLVGPGDQRRVSEGVAFDDWLVVPPGATGTVTVRGEDTAIAVYDLTEDRPNGVTVDGITFREEVAGDRLLAAAIGDVGDDEVRIEVTVPERGAVRWSTLCQAAPPGAWTHVDFGQRGEYLAGPGCQDPDFDPGAHGSTSSLGSPGATIEARVYLTEGQDGPRVDADEARLGLAAYEVAPPASRVGGYAVPELLEEDGHLWRYDGELTAPAGTPTLDYRNSDPSALQVQAISDATGDRRVTTRWDEGESGTVSSVGGGISTFLLLPGARATIAVGVPVPEQARLGFAFFERID